MIRKSCWIAAALAALVGCTSQEDTSNVANNNPPPGPATPIPPNSAPQLVSAAPAADAAPADIKDVKLTDEEIANIKKLPEADQAAALEQKICPISGSHLGTEDMGVPVKVSADGQDVFICCGGCKKEVEKDPKAVLAKLGKK
jgi:hypothetical protein